MVLRYIHFNIDARHTFNSVLFKVDFLRSKILRSDYQKLIAMLAIL